MVSRLRSPSAMSFRKLNLLQPQVGEMLLLLSSKSLVITIYDIFIVAFSKLFRERSSTSSRRLHGGLEDVIEFNANIE